MNRFKKAVFGVLVAGLAFGFSAFTTVKRQAVFSYYKTDMTYPNENDPRGYQYFSGDRCETGGSLCSAQWNIGANPAPSYDGASLSLTGVTFKTATALTGHFE